MITVDDLLEEREAFLERATKLSELITLSYKYSTNLPERELMVQQLKVMMDYVDILNQRIKAHIE